MIKDYQDIERKNMRLNLLLRYDYDTNNQNGWRSIRELSQYHEISLLDILEIIEKDKDTYELSSDNKNIRLNPSLLC